MHLRVVKQISVVLLALVVGACSALRPQPGVGVAAAGARAAGAALGTAGQPPALEAGAVSGRVDWGGARSVQAQPTDVVAAATVSFIDTQSNTTVATTKTDSGGSFSLALPGFSPVNGATYVLEAVKGLKNQQPGSAAARFRTILKWNGSAWLSITNAAQGGSIVVNALTTAVAIEAALDPGNVPPGNTIGKVNVSTNPASLNAVPGPYTGHPDAEIGQLAANLLDYLSADADPVASVPAILPSVSAFQPSTAAPNSLVSITGSGFSVVPLGNQVTFNGAPAQILFSTPTQLVIVVPSGASTGPIRVTTGRGAVNSAPFTLLEADATSLAITDVVPDSGRIDSEVTLIGSFLSDATPSVLFKGNKSPVAAEVSGWTDTSLTVRVPLGAVDGVVTIRSGLSSVESLDNFRILPGDINTMVVLSSVAATSEGALYSLPDAIRDHAGARWGNSYYLVGGLNGTAASTAQNVVRMFPINSDGTLGSVRTVGRLNTARYRHVVAAAAGKLYVIGGLNSSGTYLSDIEVATINADGSLSDFAAATPALPATRAYGCGVAYQNGGGNWFIYVLGGFVAGAVNRNYDKITLNADGTIASVAAAALPLFTGFTTGVAAFGCEIVNNKIVVAGGIYNSTSSNINPATQNAFSATFTIDASNNIASATSGANLPKALHYTQLAIVNGYAYVAGGYAAVWNGASYVATYYADVYRSLLDANGVPGAWSAVSSQIYAAPFSNIFDSGGRLYSFGGFNASGVLGVVQTAALTSSNTLDVWSIFGSNTYQRVGHASAMIGDKAWTFGGYGAFTGGANAVQKTTEYFAVRDDGTVAPSKVGPAMAKARYGATAVVAKGYLYVIGGDTGTATGPLATVLPTMERAKINANGTLGSFTELTRNPLSIPRRFAAACFYNGYIYLFGGEINGGASTYAVKTASVERVKVNDDGSVGMWELLGSVALPERRSHMQAIPVGEFIYLIGGAINGDTAVPAANNNVLAARIEPGGIIGSFNRILPLKTAVYGSACARIGSYLYSFGGFTTAATSTVQRAFINADGSLSAASTTWDAPQTLPSAVGFFTGPPHVYKNWLLMFTGGSNGTTPIDTIQEGYIL